MRRLRLALPLLLVLGAQVKPDGSPSAMLADRIDAAADLSRARKVEKLLLSGDRRWASDMAPPA